MRPWLGEDLLFGIVPLGIALFSWALMLAGCIIFAAVRHIPLLVRAIAEVFFRLSRLWPHPALTPLPCLMRGAKICLSGRRLRITIRHVYPLRYSPWSSCLRGPCRRRGTSDPSAAASPEKKFEFDPLSSFFSSGPRTRPSSRRRKQSVCSRRTWQTCGSSPARENSSRPDRSKITPAAIFAASSS